MVDFQLFLTHCHGAARQLGGQVTVNNDQLPTSANFLRVELELTTGPISVVINSMFPFVATVLPTARGDTVLQFVDNQEIARWFDDCGGYRVVTVTECQSPLTPEVYGLLSDAELKQIKYWKPRTLGEVIYNYWD